MRILKADLLRLFLPPVALVTLFIVTGLRGIDFGFHWDERDCQLLPARDMLTSGVFLSRPYNYPSVGRMLVLVPALKNGMRVLWHGGGIHQMLAAMRSAMDTPGYLLAARSVFLMVSALGIIWIYLAGWVLTGNWWEA